MTGTLFLVATPIGNLGDITLRAIETLKSADRVLAEDTRRTRALLSHLGISGKPIGSLDAHASERKTEAVLDYVARGERVAFVTDAGMPGVSDPGTALVRAAARRELEVTVIPGPSAVTTAVALSGLVDASFSFMGFLPRHGGKRRAMLDRVAASPEPVVLFEAPGRTQQTLADLAARMPSREAAVCRELTKLHEETLRGSLEALAAGETEFRGEIVIVLGPGTGASEAQPTDAELDARIVELLAQGVSTKDAVSELSSSSQLSRRDLYARVEKLRRG